MLRLIDTEKMRQTKAVKELGVARQATTNVFRILNHCDYPIHTGKLEGVNNKIKVIKRKAYGFHDLRYFTLKIYQAFYN